MWLTVTDDDGATDSVSQDVIVSDSSGGGGIDLRVTGYKVKGLKKADLEWSGTSSTMVVNDVEVHREDFGLLQKTDDDGFYTDKINQRGGGSYTYWICEIETSTCSSTVSITF